MNRSKFVILASVIFTVLLSMTCCKRISVGAVGLKIHQTGDNKGVNPMENISGWVFYNPVTVDVEEFPTSMQHVEYDEFRINAYGGSLFTMKPFINYIVDPTKADVIYRQFKTTDLDEISQRYIRNAVYQAFTNVTGKYSPDELLKNRARYEKDVFDNLKNAIGEKGFILQQVTSNMEPPKALTEAIDAKNKADQDAQKIQLEVAKVEAQAKKDIAKAKGDSAAQIIRANSNARAVLIEAECESAANKLINSSLNESIIRYRFFDVWDGKLPVYGATPTLFKDLK